MCSFFKCRQSGKKLSLKQNRQSYQVKVKLLSASTTKVSSAALATCQFAHGSSVETLMNDLFINKKYTINELKIRMQASASY